MMNHHGEESELSQEMLRRLRMAQSNPQQQAEQRRESQANIESMIKRYEQQGSGNAPREYPSGRVSPDDDGALAFAIGSDPETGIVRIDFNKHVSWLGMEPQQAVELAQMLIKHARAVSKEPISVILH